MFGVQKCMLPIFYPLDKVHKLINSPKYYIVQLTYNVATPPNLHWFGGILIKLLPLDADGGEGRLEGLGQL